MKIIDNLLCNISNESFYKNLTDGRGMFLDIETTGLKKESCCIYLIGLLYPVSGSDPYKYRLRLLFSEAPEDEILILKEFDGILKESGCFPITFNGRRFDLPFLKKRFEIYGLSVPEILNSGEDLDIYARIKPYRRSFGLSSLNQKNVEKMLDIKREDKYTGEELIKVYKEYVKNNDPEHFDRLITHNRDDVLGMTEILPVLSYAGIFENAAENMPCEILESLIETHTGFDGTESYELIIRFTLPCPVPKPHLFHNLRLFLETDGKIGKIRIPLMKGELRHYFENYKDYCYIPSEDKAVLKEIADIMNVTETEKARASNCYIRAEGLFLPLPEGYTPKDMTIYKQDLRSKNCYVLYNGEIEKSPALEEYLLKVLGKCFI